MNWDKQAKEFFQEKNYQGLVDFYEHKIETSTIDFINYIYLGLAYLFVGKEVDAQAIWLHILTQSDNEKINLLTNILDQEAHRQLSTNNYFFAWLIRIHLREIKPELIRNIIKIIQLEIELGKYKFESIINYGLENLLQSSQLTLIDLKLLWEVIPKILILSGEKALKITEISLLNHIYDQSTVIKQINEVAIYFSQRNPDLAISLTHLCLKLEPNNWQILKHLCWHYFHNGNIRQSVTLAQNNYSQVDDIDIKIYLNSQLLDLMQKGNLWLESLPVFERHKVFLKKISTKSKYSCFYDDGFISMIRALLHSEDNPRENRLIQNHLATLFENETKQNYVQSNYFDKSKTNQNNYLKFNQKIKIGYIGHTFKYHSVGWLCRWLFKYHDKEKYEIYIYAFNQLEDQMTQKWFKQSVDYYGIFSSEVEEIIQKIITHDIDILVDLDGITDQNVCRVMSLKPAKIQVTWLGSDASGIPSIDYFIADPYVLPRNAKRYYREIIWRLPQTYLGIDGFEVDAPTLTRKELDIPEEGVVYLNIQNALKRHPNLIRNQMKILKSVPNSYLLIKGSGEEEMIKELFINIANEEGLDKNRLRFLKITPTEEIHRANLKIADVVLDTYPYNGATTTLETLWMEIPLVTRVGEQFAARNSYTFMINAGITEGIAWSDEEYIEWGIKLGTDENLRKEISWKLKQSKKTSPLWNGKQFTREMEKAYQQMWGIYLNYAKL